MSHDGAVDMRASQKLDSVSAKSRTAAETLSGLYRNPQSIMTPEVAYFKSATSSLRARATIVVFFILPPLRSTRDLYHCVNADPG